MSTTNTNNATLPVHTNPEEPQPRPLALPLNRIQSSSASVRHMRVTSGANSNEQLSNGRRLKDHSRASSGNLKETGNDINEVFRGIETVNNNMEAVTKLVNFLNSDISKRISFESVCKPFLVPQSLRSAQVVFSEMIKRLISQLRNDEMRDPAVLVPLISKPILLVRNIILEIFISDNWNNLVKQVDSFSQVLIDILGLKLHGQPITPRLPEFYFVLQQISNSLKVDQLDEKV